MAQRLVRVQRKITQAGIPYCVPPEGSLPARTDSVLVTIYLIFTAGYTATSGESLLKKDLCTEAVRLGRLLVSLVPDRGEPAALLALMLFHDSRRDTRTDGAGNIVLLEDQDRSRWNRLAIQEGIELLGAVLRNGAIGSRYGIEARIASIHATSARPEDTDWPRIATLYGELKRIAPSPVVELNEAVAIAMAEGPLAGLERLAALEGSGRLDGYHLLPAAQARLLEKLGKRQNAIEHYRRALALARNEPERRFLMARLDGVSRAPDRASTWLTS
jgi:RNA polymerase sigma-70 factor (ECF subfamily)